MPTPNNINRGINLYNLADVVDAVYYSPKSQDEVEVENYKKHIPDGWILLEETSDSPNKDNYERYGHKAAVYKVPRTPGDTDTEIKEGDEIVIVARGSEFKEKFNATNAYHDMRIGAGLYHEGEQRARDYFKEMYTKYVTKADIKPKRIVVTGQSLGGNEALAMLIEAQANGWLGNQDLKVEGVGYFGPGTSVFNTWELKEDKIKQLTEHFARINVNNDIVPHAPLQKKIGKEFEIYDEDTAQYAQKALEEAGILLTNAGLGMLGKYVLETREAGVGFPPGAEWLNDELVLNLEKLNFPGETAKEVAKTILEHCNQYIDPTKSVLPSALAIGVVFTLTYGWKEIVDTLKNIKGIHKRPADIFDLVLHGVYAAIAPKLPGIYPLLPNASVTNALLAYMYVLPGIKSLGGSLFAGHSTEPIKKHFRNSPILGNMDPASLPKLGDDKDKDPQEHFKALMDLNEAQYESLTPQQRIFIENPQTSLAEIHRLISSLPQLSVSSSQQVARVLTRNEFVSEIAKLTTTIEDASPDFPSLEGSTLTAPLFEKIDALRQNEWKEVQNVLKYLNEKKTQIDNELQIKRLTNPAPRENLVGYALHLDGLSTTQLNEELASIKDQMKKIIRERLVEHNMLHQMITDIKHRAQEKLSSISDDDDDQLNLQEALDGALLDDNNTSIPKIATLLEDELEQFQDLPFMPADELKTVQQELDSSVASTLPMKLSTDTAHNAIESGNFSTEKMFEILDAQLKLISFYTNSSLIIDQPSHMTRDAAELRENLREILRNETEELKELKLTYQQAGVAYQEGLQTENSIKGSKAIVLGDAMEQWEETGQKIKRDLQARNAQLTIFERVLTSNSKSRNQQIDILNTGLGTLNINRSSAPHDNNLSTLKKALDNVSKDMDTLRHHMALMESTLTVGRTQLDSESMVRARGWLKLVNDQLQEEQEPAAMAATVGKLLKDWNEHITYIFQDINSKETPQFKQLLRKSSASSLSQQSEASIHEKYLLFVEQQLSRMTTDMEDTIKIANRLIEKLATNLAINTNPDVLKALKDINELRTTLEKELSNAGKKRNQTNLSYSNVSQRGQTGETYTYLGKTNLNQIEGKPDTYEAPLHSFDIVDKSIGNLDVEGKTKFSVRIKWENDRGETQQGFIQVPYDRAVDSKRRIEKKKKDGKDEKVSEKSNTTLIKGKTLGQDKPLAQSAEVNKKNIMALLNGTRNEIKIPSGGTRNISGWKILMQDDQRYRSHQGKYILYNHNQDENRYEYIQVHKYQIAHIEMKNNQAPANSSARSAEESHQPDYRVRSGIAKSFAESTKTVVMKEQAIKEQLLRGRPEGIKDSTLESIAAKHARSPSQSGNDVNLPIDLTKLPSFTFDKGAKLVEEVNPDPSRPLDRSRKDGLLILSQESPKDGNPSEKYTTYYQVTRNQLKVVNPQLYKELLETKSLSQGVTIQKHIGLNTGTDEHFHERSVGGGSPKL